MIIQNAVKIIEDKDNPFYLVSSHRHDFKTYNLKGGTYISVDGGTEYIRRVGDLESKGGGWIDWSLDSNDNIRIVREKLLWGHYPLNPTPKNCSLKYSLIKDLQLDHLKAIVKTQKNINPIHLKVIKYWVEEKSKSDLEKSKKD